MSRRARGGTKSARSSTWNVSLEEAKMKKIDIRKLPELATRVGIHGSVKQKEVGGATCMGVVVAIVSG